MMIFSEPLINFEMLGVFFNISDLLGPSKSNKEEQKGQEKQRRDLDRI